MFGCFLKNSSSLLFILCLSIANSSQAEGLVYDLYMRALQYDENYLTNKAQIQGAQYDSQIVERELYPSVNSSVVRSEVESVNTGPQRSVTATGRYKSTRYQLRLSQPLYDPELFDRIEAQQYSQSALNYKLAGIKQALMLNINELYWQLKVSYQDLVYQQSKLDLQKKKLRSGLLKQSRGQLSNEDINLLKAEQLGQQYQLDISQSRYLSAKNELFEVTLFDYTAITTSDTCHSLNLPVGTSEQYLDLAVRGNHEINLYRKELKASQQEYQSMRSAYLPKLNLDVEYINSSEQGGSFDGSESNKTQANLSLTWPIYMGGRRSLQSQKAASKMAMAQSKLEIYLPKLKHKIDISKHQIKLNKGLLKALLQEQKSRQARIHSIERRITLGAATQLEILEEKVSYQEFLTRQQNSCRDLITNQIELLSFIGSLNAELHLNESL